MPNQLHLSAAFRSSRTGECYNFVKNQFLVLNYAPGTEKDEILNGPVLRASAAAAALLTLENGPKRKYSTPTHIFNTIITRTVSEYSNDGQFKRTITKPHQQWQFECQVRKYSNSIRCPIKVALIGDGFHHMLAKTPFENGIDCAFDTDGNQAFIFRENQCAKIDFAPHNTKARLLSGPMTIAAMFPFLKGTVFENGIDAAIKTVDKQVFIFRGDRFAHIDYDSESLLSNMSISDAFASWVGTVFENGIDAAFASHITDEVYIFKGEYYARINVAPGTRCGDFIVGSRIKRIRDDWTSLVDILQS